MTKQDHLQPPETQLLLYIRNVYVRYSNGVYFYDGIV